MVRAFLPAFALAVAALLDGCVADPAPQANGFQVELWFEAPNGGLVVGQNEAVLVQRIERTYANCQTGESCTARTKAPLELVAASCDDASCTVDGADATTDGLALRVVGLVDGPTTIRVSVRNKDDGRVFDDAYPLVVTLPTSRTETHR